MDPNRRDMTELPDLAHTVGRAGPVRSQMPIYVDLLPPCNGAGRNASDPCRHDDEEPDPVPELSPISPGSTGQVV